MRRFIFQCALFIVSLLGLPWLYVWLDAPRAWRVEETPVAFWLWRTALPDAAESRAVLQQTGAQTLFIRAGQFDSGSAQGWRRIRKHEGRLPVAANVHLVYNATRGGLALIEPDDPAQLAQTIADTFSADSAEARTQCVSVSGLQLDLDVATRLLPRYAELLCATRQRLPPDVQLSITGLPAWMDAPALTDVLRATDFWIPQFYGAEIPARLERRVPIMSLAGVSAGVAKARELRHPFFAGLAAYGYAILYSARGDLIEVRGNLDPARVAAAPELDLIETSAFPESRTAAAAAEGRYVYLAQQDCVLDGLVIRTGERLMLDVPQAETLRVAARLARAEAGPQWLGLCIFRWPSAQDATTLTLREMQTALRDEEAAFATTLKLQALPATSAAEPPQWLLTAQNTGAVSARLGAEAFTLDLQIPAGSLREIVLPDATLSYESLCDERPCSLRRANHLRFSARAWMSGAQWQARLVSALNSFTQIPATVISKDFDGRVWKQQMMLNAEPTSFYEKQ